jgi:Zn-finger nucleic acid-binding protein
MRLIVACEECKRQYDASNKRVGDRFHCHCGAEVVVQQPQGHDAAVVSCSSCGAPREGRAEQCAHCGADFTIHERDLQTVCPSCLARVSDRARYCHHCAALLVAESVAGEATEYACPVCGQQRVLTSRRLTDEQINVSECEKCGGFWIGLETFQVLLEIESRRPPTHAAAYQPPLESERRTPYRPCAVCGKLMVRRNFGRRSGVIVDICGTHGIWFDAHELAQVVNWIRCGGLEAARLDLARLRSSTDLARKREAFREQRPAAARPAPVPMDFGSQEPEDPFAEIAEAAIQLIGRLFRAR